MVLTPFKVIPAIFLIRFHYYVNFFGHLLHHIVIVICEWSIRHMLVKGREELELSTQTISRFASQRH